MGNQNHDLTHDLELNLNPVWVATFVGNSVLNLYITKQKTVNFGLLLWVLGELDQLNSSEF